MFDTLKPGVFLPAALVLCFVSFKLFANESAEQEGSKDWFQIEYILFEHLNSDRQVLRYEDVSYEEPSVEQYQYLYMLGQPLSDNHIVPIQESESDLVDAYRKLKRDKNIKVYSAGMWKQVIEKESSSLPMQIRAGKYPGEELYKIDGALTIKRSRYMHAQINVLLSEYDVLPMSDLKDWFFEPEEQRWSIQRLILPVDYDFPSINYKGREAIARNVYWLKESRRVKDAEIHYIDHPALGMIVTIKKVDDPSILEDEYEQ